MTIEAKLKDLILTRYKSVREFTLIIDMPYTTIDSIFRRGVGNASVNNIIKICKALNISADELADGHIVSINQQGFTTDNRDVDDIVANLVSVLKYQHDLTIDGQPVTDDVRNSIVQGLEVSVELAKRHNKMDNKNITKTTIL